MSTTKKKPVPPYIRFPIAGVSGMGATLIVHPIELVKFRMQLSGEGGKARDHKTWLHAFRTIVQKDGVIGLYDGLSANLFHQSVYTTTRISLYQIILDRLRKLGYEGLLYQVPAAITGGFIASLLATPAEVVLVRMTANGRLPPSERRNYNHIFNALRRIAVEEGAKGMYTGLRPTILKAMVANVSQLVTYTQSKEFLINNGYMENNVKCHFVSSLMSGFVFSFAVCPIDVIKTRIQYMSTGTATPLYSGILDTMNKTIHKEGVTALWKGFLPLYARNAPHTILLFIIAEKLTYFYRENFAGPPE